MADAVTAAELRSAADALERGISLYETLRAVSAQHRREWTPGWAQAVADAAEGVWPTLTKYSRGPDDRWYAFRRLCEGRPEEAARRLRAVAEERAPA